MVNEFTGYLSVSTDPMKVLVFDKRNETLIPHLFSSADQYTSSDAFLEILSKSDYNNGVLHIMNDKIYISFWYQGDNKDEIYINNYNLSLLDFKQLCSDGKILEIDKPYDCHDIQKLIRQSD